MSVSAASFNQPSVPARFGLARKGLLALKTVAQQPAALENVTFEARYGTRVKFSSEVLYASRPVFATRNVYEDRAVTEERDVFETRPTYTSRPVYETQVSGTRDLSGFASASAAGLDDRADFSVRVGDQAAATIRFSGSAIALTIGGQTQNFAYTSASGSFQSALLSALNGIEGLNAALGADGRLALKTSEAQNLSLAEVPNGVLDFSGTALDKLGLVAGTTTAQQVGTVEEESGTEEVKTGTQTVVVGTERVKVGTERFETGRESYVAGMHLVEDGTERAIVGYDRVVSASGSEDNLLLRTRQVSVRQTMAQLVTAAQKDLKSTGPIGLRVVEGLAGIITLLGEDNALSASKIDAAVARLDAARGAYMASAVSGHGAAGGRVSILA